MFIVADLVSLTLCFSYVGLHGTNSEEPDEIPHKAAFIFLNLFCSFVVKMTRSDVLCLFVV